MRNLLALSTLAAIVISTAAFADSSKGLIDSFESMNLPEKVEYIKSMNEGAMASAEFRPVATPKGAPKPAQQAPAPKQDHGVDGLGASADNPAVNGGSFNDVTRSYVAPTSPAYLVDEEELPNETGKKACLRVKTWRVAFDYARAVARETRNIGFHQQLSRAKDLACGSQWDLLGARVTLLNLNIVLERESHKAVLATLAHIAIGDLADELKYEAQEEEYQGK